MSNDKEQAVFLERQSLLNENRRLKAELESYQLELEKAERRLSELNTPPEKSDYQAACKTVLSRIRHEINNPLTGVLGQAQLLLRKPDNLTDEARRRIETIEILAHRISEVFKNVDQSPSFGPPSEREYRSSARG